jgi:hypothetical protein
VIQSEDTEWELIEMAIWYQWYDAHPDRRDIVLATREIRPFLKGQLDAPAPAGQG